MARSKGRASKAKPAGGRKAKATSKKPAPAAEVEVVEEAGGEGIDTGIVIATTLSLVVAILFLDKLLAQYGEGMFL